MSVTLLFCAVKACLEFNGVLPIAWTIRQLSAMNPEIGRVVCHRIQHAATRVTHLYLGNLWNFVRRLAHAEDLQPTPLT